MRSHGLEPTKRSLDPHTVIATWPGLISATPKPEPDTWEPPDDPAFDNQVADAYAKVHGHLIDAYNRLAAAIQSSPNDNDLEVRIRAIAESISREMSYAVRQEREHRRE